jgi:hypothetical protein
VKRVRQGQKITSKQKQNPGQLVSGFSLYAVAYCAYMRFLPGRMIQWILAERMERRDAYGKKEHIHETKSLGHI